METNAKKNPQTKDRPWVEEQYLVAHDHARTMIESIRTKIEEVYDGLSDMPDPEDEERPINWHDVTCINEINGQLSQASSSLYYAIEVLKKIKY